MRAMFDYSIFGNTIFSYLSLFGIFIAGMAVVYVFRKYVLNRLKRWADATDTSVDDMLVNAIEKSLVPVFNFLNLFTMSPAQITTNTWIFSSRSTWRFLQRLEKKKSNSRTRRRRCL